MDNPLFLIRRRHYFGTVLFTAINVLQLEAWLRGDLPHAVAKYVRESARTQQRHHWCWSTKTIRLCSLYGLQSHRMSELTLPPGHRQLRQFHSSSMVFADVHLKKSIFDCFYTSRLCKDPKFWFLYSRYLFHVGSVSHILSQQYTCYLIYY
jgi:hypothetical protein